MTFLRQGVELLHEIEVKLDRKGNEPLRLIELALLASVRGNGGLTAEASLRGGLLHRAAELQALEFVNVRFFHSLTLLFSCKMALYPEWL
jgi:hypothetical protein